VSARPRKPRQPAVGISPTYPTYAAGMLLAVYLVYPRPCIKLSYAYTYAALTLTLAGLLIGREAAKAIHNLIQRKASSLSTHEPVDARWLALSTAITARCAA
jgi:hypothetical protein